ncbi:MAG: polyprenyl synthetase family protein [Candidatus Omnitrophica bacterium]|nr:polyprenyl synthetase family protein [Candidatus Omnitrophota bacterium]
MKRTRRLLQRRALVNRALNRVLKLYNRAPRRLHEAMRYCVVSGGKRFRPLLCVGASEAVGGTAQRALSVACAIELIHTYSLVHDDLPAMDDADHRRGRPSCHRRFGEATAVLVGDALLTRAFEVLGSNGVPNILAIIRTLGEASGTGGLIGGQILDLKAEDNRQKAEGSPPRLEHSAGRGKQKAAPRYSAEAVKQLEEIARRKTAALIAASVVAGGLTHQVSPKVLEHLKHYGAGLGLAFQLMDDLHDGDGLARAIGSEEVQRKAIRLIAEAKRELTVFGSRAWLLTELAGWLAST